MPAKAKIQQFTVPITALVAGRTYGPFTTGNLPTQLQGYEIDLQNDATWPVGDPANPQTVLHLAVEVSLDGGQTWLPDASIDLADQDWVLKNGTVTNSSLWVVTLPTDNVATRQARLTAQCLIACKLGATLSSF